MIDKKKVLTGRKAVDTYREAHTQLYVNGSYKGISEDHTPLLKKLVAALEKLGITSSKTDFEPRKTEVLAKFWEANDLQNIKELGFVDRKDFGARATKADREALEAKWR